MKSYDTQKLLILFVKMKAAKKIVMVSSGLSGRDPLEIWFDVLPKPVLGIFQKFTSQSLLFDAHLKLCVSRGERNK